MMAKKKILVISNDPLTLRFLRQNLDEMDFQIICTQHSGDELRTVLDKELPDLVIVDTGKSSLPLNLLAAAESGGFNQN